MELNNNSEVDTLKVYGNAFQNKCISALVSDKGFLEQIVDILSYEYFEMDSHKWTVRKITEYFLKYKELPTFDVFKVEIKSIPESQADLKFGVFEEIKKAYSHTSDTDVTYVKEQFLTFCKQQKLKRAILNSADHLNHGNYEAIKHEIDEAMRAGVERNLGHEYLVGIDDRMSLMARSCVRTAWPIIDARMDGGLGNGELAFVVAPAGSGKSWLLMRFGAEAMKQGKHVLHVTLELSENYVGLRYDAYFAGIAFQDVRKNIPAVKSKLEEHKNNGGGQLFVKYFPLKTVSPHSLKQHIERLQLINGIKIGMLIVDYADILRPFMADRNSNSYNEAGSVYEELRQIAGELQIPVWSASQSNRGAHDEEVIQAHNVADSYRKIMTGDFIISLSRRMEDKMANTGRIHIIKNRFGQDGDTFPIEFDTSMGYANVFDPDSSEGKAILAKSQDSEDGIQDLLRNKWNEHKANGGARADQN
jgi:replicative DNA helicase